jgi:hypothetical protein
MNDDYALWSVETVEYDGSTLGFLVLTDNARMLPDVLAVGTAPVRITSVTLLDCSPDPRSFVEKYDETHWGPIHCGTLTALLSKKKSRLFY